ncbi:Rne/Rng family ribonuclease [Acidimicrobiia bacterium]|nr:Rne/Rng family ribonuclease [Acidimicrobiia bacterium]
MFGLFKKSKVIRKSDEPLNKTETKWFKGQKVKIKTGTTVSRPNRKNYRNNRSNNQTWFKEAPLPVPNVEKKQMLISFKGGSSKIAILEGASLVEYYSAQDKKKSLVGNIYLGKVKNILPGMEAAFVSFGEEKNGVIYVADISNSKRNSKIEHLLKPEQEILVQVVKDAMGEKGARLTGQISFPGRYLVLIPNSNTKGISRRLPEQERTRLDRIIRKIKPEGFGVIVRTAAEGVSESSLKNDIDKLADEWAAVSSSNQGTAPVLIHEEPDVSIKVIREHLNSNFKKLLIEKNKNFDIVQKYVEDTSPELTNIIESYDDKLNLFERYHIEDQIQKALDRKVWLPSGGHLIIDPTEALTVIDVNTGKFVGKDSLEETVYENNLEAAEEIARQLRLRDIGGIIVIDFIDMESIKKQQSLLTKLKQELAKDKTRTQVFEVSRLGLVEMTRKNVAAGLIETFSEECEECNGRGLIINDIFSNNSQENNILESEAVVE